MSRRAWAPLLVGVNAILLTTLILAAWDLPQAQAQRAPMAPNYVMVSAVILQGHDALAVIDLDTRLLHIFEVDQTTKQLVLRDSRDLKQDFRRGR